MSDALTLKFLAPERIAPSSRLELMFRRISEDELSVDIRAKIRTFRGSAGPLEFSVQTLCYGYDLAEFARELEQLHARYDGTAKFVDQVESFELRFTLTDKARGILSILARYEHDIELLAPIELRCFELEQSYIPGLLWDIRHFLADSGTSIAHPFDRAPSV